MISTNPKSISIERAEILSYLKKLRNEIRTAFESFEKNHRFSVTPWDYKHEGGGEISVLRGDVFEKAAVNFSAVGGPEFPMGDAEGPFFATGVSLITHMKNPYAPTVHMNLRYIEANGKTWFGGGYDLTPMGFPFEEDKIHFHNVAEKATGSLYPKFSEAAAKYFFIPHRNKERGQGGLFFDHYNTGDQNKDFTLWKKIGDTFLDSYIPILEKRIHTPYTTNEKEIQKKARAHYVEFNLLYDRGTKFGFQSGGNPEAILCSMPPEASW